MSVNKNNGVNDTIAKGVICLVVFVLNDCESVVFQVVNRV